jgi:hypothetical protein
VITQVSVLFKDHLVSERIGSNLHLIMNLVIIRILIEAVVKSMKIRIFGDV